MRKLPHWVLTDSLPAFYDSESLTAIQQTARLYAAMDELIAEYNSFVDELNTHIEEFENGLNKDLDAFETKVTLLMESHTKTLNEMLDYIKKELLPETEEAIQLAHELQAQIDQLVIEGDSSVEAAQARVDADGNTYTTLKDRLDTKEEQITKNTAQISKDTLERKNLLFSSASIVENNPIKDVVYYQAEVKNPISTQYTAAPIEIKIKFEQGECKNENCLVVRDNNGDVTEHQWIGETHPNPLIKANLSTYLDGSLKAGSIFILDTIIPNDSKIFTIEVHQVEQDNTFTDNVSLTVDTSNTSNYKETLTAGGTSLQFIQSANYWLRFIYRGEDYVSDSTTYAHRIWVIDPDKGSHHVDSASVALVSKTLSGSGVIFKDYDFEWQHVATPSIKYFAKVRLFVDGSFKIDSKIQFTEEITNISGVAHGVNLAESGTAGANYVTNSNMIVQAYKSQMNYDFIDSSIVYGVKTNVSDKNITVLWTGTTGDHIPANSIFTNTYYVSFTNTTTNHQMNQLAVHGTKKTVLETKKNVLKLSKRFFDFLYNGSELATITNFPGLTQFYHLVNSYLNKDINIVDSSLEDGQIAINKYIMKLEDTYQNFTLDGLKNVYQGVNSDERGIEYIGRDTSPLKYFIQACEDTGKSTSKERLIEMVHILADFYVWLENNSGGNGAIVLNNGGVDALNSEATAIKALAHSLTLESNETRQNTLNRINNHFLSGLQNKNLLPYDQVNNTDVTIHSIGHYAAFSLFEYCRYNTDNFDLMAHVNQFVNASGKIDEIGFNPSIRAGYYHTSLYIAYVAYQYGTISSLQLAESLLENILDNCLPNGTKVFPLDRWVKQADTIDAPILAQIVGELLLDEIM